MVLNDQDITDFQSIYRNEFGKEISREDAYEQGIKLLRLMSIVHKPMTQKEFDLIQVHRRNTVSLLSDKLNENQQDSLKSTDNN